MSEVRQMRVTAAAITASSATTQLFSYRGARGGGFVVTSLATAASCTFVVATEVGGTLADLKDANNVAISQALTAGDAYEIPTEAFAFAQIGIVANAGTAVMELCLKS